MYFIHLTGTSKDIYRGEARYCDHARLSVCLFVCVQNNSKSYDRIWMKFSGFVDNDKRKVKFEFGSDPTRILDLRAIKRPINLREKKFKIQKLEISQKRLEI